MRLSMLVLLLLTNLAIAQEDGAPPRSEYWFVKATPLANETSDSIYTPKEARTCNAYERSGNYDAVPRNVCGRESSTVLIRTEFDLIDLQCDRIELISSSFDYERTFIGKRDAEISLNFVIRVRAQDPPFNLDIGAANSPSTQVRTGVAAELTTRWLLTGFKSRIDAGIPQLRGYGTVSNVIDTMIETDELVIQFGRSGENRHNLREGRDLLRRLRDDCQDFGDQ